MAGRRWLCSPAPPEPAAPHLRAVRPGQSQPRPPFLQPSVPRSRADPGLCRAVHVCWQKFCRYFSVEERYVPVEEGRYVSSPELMKELIDENTIGEAGRAGGVLWHRARACVLECFRWGTHRGLVGEVANRALRFQPR